MPITIVSMRRRLLRAPARGGMTLVELLVVIAIIGTLIGLLLPAVQAVRSSVRNVACLNRLRQMGQAVQSHISEHRTFPTGGNEYYTPPTFIGGKAATLEKQDASWAFQILPYVEESAVWQPSGATDEDRQIAAIAATISLYFCPARRGPHSISYIVSSSYPATLVGRMLTRGLIDYAGSNMAGTGALVQAGTLLPGKPRRPAEVTDGLSKTLVVAEKRLNVAALAGPDHSIGDVPDDNEGYTAGWDEDTIRYCDRDHPPGRDSNSIDAGSTGEGKFGSSHENTFNAVFADGSARGLAYTIDPEIFEQLGNIHDGKTVSLD